jgi:hypothetical protein
MCSWFDAAAAALMLCFDAKAPAPAVDGRQAAASRAVYLTKHTSWLLLLLVLLLLLKLASLVIVTKLLLLPGTPLQLLLLLLLQIMLKPSPPAHPSRSPPASDVEFDQSTLTVVKPHH